MEAAILAHLLSAQCLAQDNDILFQVSTIDGLDGEIIAPGPRGQDPGIQDGRLPDRDDGMRK